MAEETGVSDVQITDDAPDQSQVDQPQGQTPSDSKEKTYGERYVKQLRDEAANTRKELQQLKADKTAADDAKLKEQGEWQKIAEQREKDILAANERYRTAKVEAAIASKAAELGVKKVHRLRQMVEADIEFGDDGAPTNLDALIKAALEDVPTLVETVAGAKPNGGGPTNPARGGDNIPAFDHKNPWAGVVFKE